MLVQLAWKNIFRNKKRSLIMMLTVTFGLVGGLAASAVLVNFREQSVANGINLKYGHIQIHHPEFQVNMDPDACMPNGDSLLSLVRNLPGVRAAAGRVLVSGMVSSAWSGNGLNILGVNPDDEMKLNNFPRLIVEGNWFDDKTPNQVLISKVVAKKLGVRPGSRVVITVQDRGKSITGGNYRVTGLFESRDAIYDYSVALVKRPAIASLTGFTGEIHEIIVQGKELKNLSALKKAAAAQFPSFKTDNWEDLAPELVMMRESTKVVFTVVMTIIMLALSFGIANTMLMAVMERTREFGVLMAIGMNRSKVFGMILMETFMLTGVSSLLGVFLARGLLGWFSMYGLDLSMFSTGLSAFGVNNIIYPDLPAESYAELLVMILMVTTFSALYPAIKATRLRPTEAIRIK